MIQDVRSHLQDVGCLTGWLCLQMDRTGRSTPLACTAQVRALFCCFCLDLDWLHRCLVHRHLHSGLGHRRHVPRHLRICAGGGGDGQVRGQISSLRCRRARGWRRSLYSRHYPLCSGLLISLLDA